MKHFKSFICSIFLIIQPVLLLFSSLESPSVLPFLMPLQAQEESLESTRAEQELGAGIAPLNEADIPVQLNSRRGQEEGVEGGEQGTAARSGAASREVSSANSVVSTSVYLKVFLILGSLIILIYFTLKFLRRLSLQKPRLLGMGTGIQVLSSQVLYADRMLHIVEVGGECYLLGSSSNGVQLLDHYQEVEVKDRVILEATEEPGGEGLLASGTDFMQMLRNRLQGRRRSTGSKAGSVPSSTAELHEGKEQVDEASRILQRSSEYRQRLRSASQSLQAAMGDEINGQDQENRDEGGNE